MLSYYTIQVVRMTAINRKSCHAFPCLSGGEGGSIGVELGHDLGGQGRAVAQTARGVQAADDALHKAGDERIARAHGVHHLPGPHRFALVELPAVPADEMCIRDRRPAAPVRKTGRAASG